MHLWPRASTSSAAAKMRKISRAGAHGDQPSILTPAHINQGNQGKVHKSSFCTAESREADGAQGFFPPSTHLDQAEADPLFGQVGVKGDVWLRLHH